MAIRKNSAGRTLYVLRNTTTGDILNRGVVYPNLDETAPVEGLDPNLEYLPIDDVPPPDVDTRVWSLQKKEEAADGVWRVSFEPEKRPDDELKIAAFNQKQNEVNKILDSRTLNEDNARFQGILLRQIDNLVITTQERAMLEKASANYAILEELGVKQAKVEADIEAGKEPDLDSIKPDA